MGTAYCTRSDVYVFGLPRGTVGIPARAVANATASDDTLELDDHGFETGDQIFVRPSAAAALPAPLEHNAPYFVLRTSDATFQLAATADGGAIDITADGGGFYVWAPLPFDRVIEYCSRFADPFIPAHLVPLEQPIPIAVVGAVATLAAKILQRISGTTSISVDAAELAAKAQLERWAKGVPLRDAAATAPANLAVSSASIRSCDSRGWGSDRIR